MRAPLRQLAHRARAPSSSPPKATTPPTPVQFLAAARRSRFGSSTYGLSGFSPTSHLHTGVAGHLKRNCFPSHPDLFVLGRWWHVIIALQFYACAVLDTILPLS